MERVQQEQISRDAANAGHVAQGKSAQLPAQADIASRIHNSPLMIAQAKQLQGMFGGVAQLQEMEEEALQGKTTSQLKLPDNLKSSVESNAGQKNVAQMRSLAPQTSAGAPLAHAGNTATFDDQAPQTLSQYNLNLADAASRNEAANNIKNEYRSFGRSLGNGANSFISRGTINAWLGDAGQGALVYDRYLGRGVPLGPIVGEVTNEKKKNAVRDYADWRSPAIMDNLLNWNALPLIDPLKIQVTCPVTGGDPVSTSIEFTEAHRGYVSHVAALGVDAPMARVPKYGDGVAGNPRFDNADYVGALDSYSMTHHSASNTTADQQMNAAEAADATLKQKEEGVDALTKIIAEGGRFNCVDAMGSAITNDTKFYISLGLEPGPVTYRYLEFRNLWTKWAGHSPNGFDKQYGITDQVVRAYLNADPLKADVHEVNDLPDEPRHSLAL
jgi:hypothetical protein